MLEVLELRRAYGRRDSCNGRAGRMGVSHKCRSWNHVLGRRSDPDRRELRCRTRKQHCGGQSEIRLRNVRRIVVDERQKQWLQRLLMELLLLLLLTT